MKNINKDCFLKILDQAIEGKGKVYSIPKEFRKFKNLFYRSYSRGKLEQDKSGIICAGMIWISPSDDFIFSGNIGGIFCCGSIKCFFYKYEMYLWVGDNFEKYKMAEISVVFGNFIYIRDFTKENFINRIFLKKVKYRRNI